MVAESPRIDKLEDPTLITDDSIATKLGLKQYLHGVDFTVSSDAAATVVIIRGVAIPYQTTDGDWRLKGNIVLTHGSDTSLSVSISDVVFKNVASYFQPAAIGDPNGRAYAVANTGDINVAYDSGVTATRLSFDVELDSKPSWAF